MPPTLRPACPLHRRGTCSAMVLRGTIIALCSLLFALFIVATRHGFTRRFESGPAPKLKKETRRNGGFPFLMGRITGFEPATPGTTNQCSNQLSYIRHTGGADRTRTDDPLHAMQVLYQLSYNPMRGLILYFFLPNVKSIC